MEIKRIKNVYINNNPEIVKCLGCGRKIELWFNGGELDEECCCGYKYYTTATNIDLVIEKDKL